LALRSFHDSQTFFSDGAIQNESEAHFNQASLRCQSNYCIHYIL
jgi:hypothetical protein